MSSLEENSTSEDNIDEIIDEIIEGDDTEEDEDTEDNAEEDIDTEDEEIIEEEIIEEEDFMFIYEHNDNFYSCLDKISPSDEDSVIIFPVFCVGCNTNMNSEEIIYSESDDKYTSTSENGSWLDIIHENHNVEIIDVEEVVIHDGIYFHCDGDLLHHLIGGEAETVEIIK